MRACFLGQNICALGYGVATLQAPPLVMDEDTLVLGLELLAEAVAGAA